MLGLQNISLCDVGLRSELFRLRRQSAIAVTSAAFNSSDYLEQPRCGRARVTSSISTETPLIAQALEITCSVSRGSAVKRVGVTRSVVAAVLRQTVVTDSEFHVTDGTLDIVLVFAGGMGCILRILPDPVFVEEDDVPSNAPLSSQRARLRTLTDSSDRISSRTLSFLASIIWFSSLLC